jgi:dipeptidyl-peptidase-4
MGNNYFWFQYLANQGYIIVSVDGRGTGGRGEAFSKTTYQRLGEYETQDQINAAKYLAQLPYIDPERIGIFGWSFGGYLSSLCLMKGADIFKAAIAVAPVTHWKLYNTIYTERYLKKPEDNKSGYEDNSPLNFTHLINKKDSKGKFLLIHGTGDDNVHAQNTWLLTEKLTQQGIPFDLMIYPNENHGIRSTNKIQYHIYQKMTEFIQNNL